MKKLFIIGAVAAAAVITGCKSIEVDNRGSAVALDGEGNVIKDVKGNPIILDKGWNVDYFQHWNWQKFDSFDASVKTNGEVHVGINGYVSGADSNLNVLVSTSLNGVATITEKVCAAIITYGGSVAAEGGSAAIAALVNKFVASGGKVDAAKVTPCEDGSCTITDGCVTCTEPGVCTDCQPNAAVNIQPAN